MIVTDERTVEFLETISVPCDICEEILCDGFCWEELKETEDLENEVKAAALLGRLVHAIYVDPSAAIWLMRAPRHVALTYAEALAFCRFSEEESNPLRRTEETKK